MFRHFLNDKIGHTLAFLASEIDDLYLTKAMKLLYLLDEISVKETGVPFTWLDYKVWGRGPVPEEIYDELNEPFLSKFNLMKEFITTEKRPNPAEQSSESTILHPKIKFDENEFTDYEIELLKRVVKEYGKLSGNQLIDLLHKQGSLWDTEVRKKELELQFKLQGKKTNHNIDFTMLLEGDETKQKAYESAFNSMTFHENLLTNF